MIPLTEGTQIVRLRDESRGVGARGWGRGAWGLVFNGEFQFCKMKRSEDNGGDGCTTVLSIHNTKL